MLLEVICLYCLFFYYAYVSSAIKLTNEKTQYKLLKKDESISFTNLIYDEILSSLFN